MTTLVHQMIEIFRCILRALLLILLLSSFVIGQNAKKYSLPDNISTKDYSHDFIIVKLKMNDDNEGTEKAEEWVKAIKGKKASKALPFSKPNKQNNNPKTNIDLSKIFRIELTPGQDVVEAISILLNREDVEYAEPYFLTTIFTSPDDPAASITGGAQYYLKNINAYNAWEIEKGNPKIIVGVVDTGVDYEHEDLKSNHFKNLSDPVDKFDNDGDGFIDNFLGWDYADNDNIPMSDKNPHGTQVAGVIAGTPNNSTGIAGIGYNSSYMPIKVFRSKDNMFFGGYEAILYAAEKGCSVINLSWGAANAYSNYAQEIINYVVLEKDVVIVAAAGNSGTDVYFYPASYNNVLSVAASDIDDKKASWSTYNDKVDVIAPGTSVYTSTNGNLYAHISGTSLSTPLVAGAAALVRAKYPNLNAVQVMEKLRVSSDDIYGIAENKAFAGKLGKGRLNIEKALQDINLPSIKIATTTFENKFGNYAFFDDTLNLKLSFKNYLEDASSIKFTLSSENNYASIIDSVFVLESLKSLEIADNFKHPFKVYLKSNLPANHTLKFKLKIESNGFLDYQIFTIVSSPAFLTLGNGGLEFTVASNGNLGINNDYNFQGSGLTYRNQRILEQVGMIVSTGPSKVLNNVIKNFDYGMRDADFYSTENIKYYDDSEAILDARSGFQPTTGSTNYIGLNIDQKVLAWKGPSDQEFVILEYRISNISGSDITNFNTGVFANWDINDKNKNIALWDATHKLGYVYDKLNKNIFAGISLLTSQDPNYFALDQQSYNGNTSTFGSDFTRENKYHTLANGTSQVEAGVHGSGNDISHTIGATIGNLKNGESIKVAFAFVAGENLEDLRENVQQALKRYNEYNSFPPTLLSVSTCAGSTALINPPGDNYEFFEDINLSTLISKGTMLTTEAIWEPSVIYATNMDKGFRGDVRQIKIILDETLPDFEMSADTLIIQQGNSGVVNFYDRSKSANNWSWTFNNGYKSTVKDPKIKFTVPGIYDIVLDVKNKTGCTGSITKKLVVLQKGNAPIIDDQFVCLNENIIIEAANTSIIKVYSDEELKNLVYSGNQFSSDNIQISTKFYVTNAEETVESDPIVVQVYVKEIKAEFDFYPDTTNLYLKNNIQFKNLSTNSSSQEWYVNGVLISTEFEPLYELKDNNDKEITLKVWNDNKCMNSHSRIMISKKSIQPENKSYSICKGENVIIRPGSGKVYYFYEDQNLKNILYKGSELIMEDILDSKEIYVTNADFILESDPATISININKTVSDFIITNTPKEIIINEIIEIENRSIGAVHYLWDLGNGEIQETKNPLIKYNVSGNYKIKLIVTAESGCTDTIEKELFVNEAKEQLDLTKNLIQLYPNPSHGSIKLNLDQLKDDKVNVNVKNNIGELIYSSWIINTGNLHQFDFSNLTAGIYHFNIQTSSGNYSERLIISR